jgi:predicted AlkP superfamily phosphohydrolase/phosphomutase
VRIAASLAEQYDVHVLAINLMLTDHANHKMPRMELVHEAYIQSDADIGALLAAFQPDNVLLISDHGSSRLKGDFLLNVWLQEHGYCVYGENNLGQQNGALDWILRQWLQGHLGWSGRPAKVLRRAIRNVLPRLPRAMQRQFWTRIEKVIPFAESHVRLSTKPDYNRTAVFPGSLYSGLLYFNVSSPTLSGPIPAQDRISLAAKLKDELADVREPDTGKPLFANVYSSEELYSGSAVRDAPDVVLDAFRSQWNIRTRQPAPFKGKQHSRYFITFDEKRDFGWHSPEGVFVFSGPAFRPGRASNAACLMDVPATLLHLYGVPVPEDWDGQVLVDLLTSELGQRPVRSQPGDAEQVSVQDDGLSEEEADSLVSHLRALGYLD